MKDLVFDQMVPKNNNYENVESLEKPSSGSAEICGYNILTHPLEVKKSLIFTGNNPLYKDMYIREYLECFARLSKVECV
ncbi:MAG: hypothetical protein IPG55_05420 [Saprospiraceae bacterium]|nr:hypothetical protein [Candidatus Defluviibacterium haderslevense]